MYQHNAQVGLCLHGTGTITPRLPSRAPSNRPEAQGGRNSLVRAGYADASP
jgi:hypothetical protein